MFSPVEHAPLAPHCTLRIGGPARYLVEATDEARPSREAVEWAASRHLPVDNGCWAAAPTWSSPTGEWTGS